MDDSVKKHPDLDEFLDDPRRNDVEGVRSHIAGCRACTEELAALTELRALARSLPREIAPRADLWAGIAERISVATGERPGRAALPPPASTRRVWRRPQRGLAAAAVILMMAGAGTTGYLLRGSDLDPALAARSGTSAEAAPMGLAAFASTESEYRYTVEMLETQLQSRRNELSPATIAAVEENLAIIDNAIAEARRALADDPTSPDLPLLLAGVYRQKVELLRQAVDLSARS